MSISFKHILDSILIESLHPELQHIIQSDAKFKHGQIVKKIRELQDRGESTGIEGNMPKGSSRAYLKHDDSENIILDNKPARLQVGTKVAIRSVLDRFHVPILFENHSLGQMQNKAENNDSLANQSYRVLTKDHSGNFHTNRSGIFPPLIDYDNKSHYWAKVGHIKNVSNYEFRALTKTHDFPTGITHKDFCSALNRRYLENMGKYWPEPPHIEQHLDMIDQHPLVKNFHDYHSKTGHPPYDYQQIANMGIFEHPDGSKRIVARDHGYSSDVQLAYQMAIKKINQT